MYRPQLVTVYADNDHIGVVEMYTMRPGLVQPSISGFIDQMQLEFSSCEPCFMLRIVWLEVWDRDMYSNGQWKVKSTQLYSQTPFVSIATWPLLMISANPVLWICD